MVPLTIFDYCFHMGNGNAFKILGNAVSFPAAAELRRPLRICLERGMIY